MLIPLVLLGAGGCARRPPQAGPIGFSIEKPAMALPGNPKPRYPDELKPTGDTGTVRVRLVVEKNGTPDMKSVSVVSSPHPAFTREVLRVLKGYRFLPAEVGGGMPRGCQPGSTPEVQLCQYPGRPGKKLRMAVEMAFVFEVPPA